MLVCYARELKEGFVNYVEETTKLMVPLLRFYFHEGDTLFRYLLCYDRIYRALFGPITYRHIHRPLWLLYERKNSKSDRPLVRMTTRRNCP
jgi:hypothetical protein